MEKVYTKQNQVACNGTDVSSHPKVYLNVEKKGQVSCPYCSKTFIFDHSGSA